MKTGDPQGLCDTTATERFAFPDCKCGTYAGNLGPCRTWLASGNPLFCVYCAHGRACHEAVALPTVALPREDWARLGEAHRVLRVSVGQSPAEVGRPLGLSSRQVSDMEHGREDPTPILELLWAALRRALAPSLVAYDLPVPTALLYPFKVK